MADQQRTLTNAEVAAYLADKRQTQGNTKTVLKIPNFDVDTPYILLLDNVSLKLAINKFKPDEPPSPRVTFKFVIQGVEAGEDEFAPAVFSSFNVPSSLMGYIDRNRVFQYTSLGKFLTSLGLPVEQRQHGVNVDWEALRGLKVKTFLEETTSDGKDYYNIAKVMQLRASEREIKEANEELYKAFIGDN